MDEAEFLTALSRFLSDKRETPTTVGPQTDLLADGLVDSLIMVEILMLIEQLTGAPVDPDLLEPEAFESGTRLYQTFFARNAAMEGR